MGDFVAPGPDANSSSVAFISRLFELVSGRGKRPFSATKYMFECSCVKKVLRQQFQPRYLKGRDPVYWVQGLYDSVLIRPVESLGWASEIVDTVVNSDDVAPHVKAALHNTVRFDSRTRLNNTIPWLKAAYAAFEAQKTDIQTAHAVCFFEVTVRSSVWEYFAYEIKRHLHRTVCLPYWTMCDGRCERSSRVRDEREINDEQVDEVLFFHYLGQHRHMIFMTAEKDEFVRILVEAQHHTSIPPHGGVYAMPTISILVAPIISMYDLMVLVSRFASEEAACVNRNSSNDRMSEYPYVQYNHHFYTNVTMFHHSLFHMCVMFPGCCELYTNDRNVNWYGLQRCINPLNSGFGYNHSTVQLCDLDTSKHDKGYFFVNHETVVPVVPVVGKQSSSYMYSAFELFSPRKQ